MQLDRLSADARGILRKVLADFGPPPKLTVSEWAEQRRVLTRSFSAEPGNWRNARTPWVVEAMDCLTALDTECLVITGGSQVSKSETALNMVGFVADIEPANVLYVVPDDGLAVEFSRRLDDMIDAVPSLKAKFASRRQRGAHYNQTSKSFAGGNLAIVGAGSPSALSARPCRIVIADELDRVRTIRGEGDAVSLARARQSTFFNRKALLVSTPTVAGGSRIEAAYAETDQCVWQARCPDCGDHRVLDWQHVDWEPGKPETATYIAPCCGAVWQDARRWEAGAAGHWQPTAEGKRGWRGFRYPGLASPWVRLETLAQEFEAAKTPALKQPFWNLRLGLPYEVQGGDGINAETIRELAEEYRGDTVPERAALLTAGCDVQAGWIAALICAWGDGDECWPLAWEEIPGDAADPATWAKVEAFLTQPFAHPSGETFRVEAAAIDSGFSTQHVYEFSAKHRARGRAWFAIKGQAGAGRPIWSRGGDIARSLAKIFLIGSDAAKTQIMGGLAQADHGPGKVHTRQSFPDHFWQWATAEECLTTEAATGLKREWRLRRGQRRNEVLDCLCYALGARYSKDFRIPARLERMAHTGTIKPAAPNMADLAARMAAVINHQETNRAR